MTVANDCPVGLVAGLVEGGLVVAGLVVGGLVVAGLVVAGPVAPSASHLSI